MINTILQTTFACKFPESFACTHKIHLTPQRYCVSLRKKSSEYADSILITLPAEILFCSCCERRLKEHVMFTSKPSE